MSEATSIKDTGVSGNDAVANAAKALTDLTATRLPALSQPSYDQVEHPAHYGGDSTYEAIKVINAWGLGFELGSAVKYIARAGHKPGSDYVTDLEKAVFYIQHEIARAKG